MGTSAVDVYVVKSKRWRDEITAVRPVLLGCGLDEAIKWGKPCYSYDGHNIVIVQEMNDFLALMFFKGALIDDTAGVLEDQGPNSRSAKRICLRSVDDVTTHTRTIEDYVRQAVANEDAGIEVAPAPDLELAPEIRSRLQADPALAEAFAALTPGRRREYHLHVSSAKQATTRQSRFEACVDRILAGKGLRDR